MSEQLKFLVQELNRSPFNVNHNIIAFDALDGRKLMPILTSVLAEISPAQKIDLRSEPLEDAVNSITNLLQIFQYPFPDNNIDEFQTQMLIGDVKILRDVLEWLLNRVPELKKRAYLGRFLLKLDIPQEFLGDMEMSELYQQYLEMMEHFKMSHREVEQLRTASLTTTEIKSDIDNMLEEKKQLMKRVDKLKKKVNGFQNAEEILEVARNLRREREKEENLNNSKQELRNAIYHADQKLQRLKTSSTDIKNSIGDITPEILIHNLEQELQVNTYIVREKLPKETKVLQIELEDLEKVASNNDLKRSDLNALYDKVQDLNNKINKMVEKRTLMNDPMDDKLSMFRQQAAIITRKKEGVAETIKELRNELTTLENSLKEKKIQLKELGGVEILKGDEFKTYVSKLRDKSDEYKKKRQEFNDVKAEIGVLSRTIEILRKRADESEETLSNLEAEKGISGYRNESNVEEGQESMSELSESLRKMNQQIQNKKLILSPVVKELQQLRQKRQDFLPNYEEKKLAYNSVAAGLDVNHSKLEREVKKLQDENNSMESQIYHLNCKIEIQKVQLEQAKNEMKSYLSTDPTVKKHSKREQFSQCIQEQEKLAKSLKEEQKNIRESQESNVKQMKMWQDLQRLLDSKRSRD